MTPSESTDALAAKTPVDLHGFMYNLARFLVDSDQPDAVRLLRLCSVEASEETDEWNNTVLRLVFVGPRRAYNVLRNNNDSGAEWDLYKAIRTAVNAVLPKPFDCAEIDARIRLVDPPAGRWQDTTADLLAGGPVDNQAVGFDQTQRSYEGLGFRSESEVRIAQALDRMRAMYLPNCRGRVGSHPEARHSIEADFIVFLNGKWGVLEVDGEPFHAPERSAHEHDRDRTFKRHGAAVVERFDAKRCYNEPDRVVAEFLTLLKGQVD
jgi:hypothetical protein